MLPSRPTATAGRARPRGSDVRDVSQAKPIVAVGATVAVTIGMLVMAVTVAVTGNVVVGLTATVGTTGIAVAVLTAVGVAQSHTTNWVVTG